MIGVCWHVVVVPLQLPGGIAVGGLPPQDAATPQDVPAADGVWQTPATHVSTVQGLLSAAHAVPSGAAAWAQPLAGLQESVVHGSPSLQFTALPPPHVPDEHFSPVVQASPSSQEFPVSGFAEQPPGSLQTPEWH